MRKKQVGFDQIFDGYALRVMLADVTACYAALGLVHARWTPIPAEFDDHIANPKPNGYRSLHTAVIGPSGKTIEVQLRTADMHQQAEFGVAAHWRYKEGEVGAHAKIGQTVEAKAAWLRQVLEWSGQDSEGPGEPLTAGIGASGLNNRVYAMTPRGDILDLPQDATPLDFAYRVHTDIGHRCRGAKVNGSMVPLTYKLRSGDCVDILTLRSGTPSRDWLNPNLGYLKTPRARSKVRAWLKRLDHDQNKADGNHAFAREVSRLGLHKVDRHALVRRFNCASFDDLMAALGGGDISAGQLTSALQKVMPRPQPAVPPARPHSRASGGNSDVEIQGVDNLLTTVARSCYPVPPIQIVGCLTRGRGVSIHRQDCGNVLRLNHEDRARLIDVSWRRGTQETYPVIIHVTAYGRTGLLRDVTTAVSAGDVDISALHAGGKRKDETVLVTLTVEVRSLAELGRVLDRVGQITNVVEAKAAPS